MDPHHQAEAKVLGCAQTVLVHHMLASWATAGRARGRDKAASITTGTYSSEAWAQRPFRFPAACTATCPPQDFAAQHAGVAWGHGSGDSLELRGVVVQQG